MTLLNQPLKSKTDVGIVIVNFHSEQYIVNLLNTLWKKRKTDFEVVIISNSGPFKDAENLKYDFNVKIIPAKNNIGFARACNLGVKNLNTKYVLFVNPDVIITSEIIDKLYEIFEENPESGAIKPIVGGDKIVFRPPFELKSITNLNIGSTFMICRNLFWEIGGFDESYFLWYEDTDIRDRILKKRRPILMVNNIVLPHVNMHSTYDVPEEMAKFFVKAWMCSHVNYLNKQMGVGAGLIWCIVKILKSMYRLIIKEFPDSPHKKFPKTAILFGFLLLVNFYRIREYVKFDGEKYNWGGKPVIRNYSI